MIGESIPEQGLKPQEAPKVKAPCLQKIAENVFVGMNDSEEDRVRKEAGGFCVIEDQNKTVERKASLLRGGAEGVVSVWAENPRNFRDLIGLIATNNPVLELSRKTEDELSLLLYKGAQAELSTCKNYIAEEVLLGDKAKKVVTIRLVDSAEEAQIRIAGLETFQKNLLEQAGSK